MVIEQGDDDNRAQVVKNRNRQQKDFGGLRNLASDQHQNANRKRDIGRGRNRPSVHIRRSAVDNRVNNRGTANAAQRRQTRHQHLADVGQKAFGHFAFQFQTDLQEKEHHQNVVDPPFNRFREHRRSDAEGYLRFQKMRDGFAGGRVGANNSGNHGENHNQTAGGFVVDEIFKPLF